MNMNRGGKWEDTHGGVKAGENSIEGIKRELKEELGINVDDNELKLIKTLKKENVFRDCYIIKKDIDLSAVKYNDGEVVNAKYVTIDEFNSMLLRNETLEYLKYFSTLYKEIIK